MNITVEHICLDRCHTSITYATDHYYDHDISQIEIHIINAFIQVVIAKIYLCASMPISILSHG